MYKLISLNEMKHYTRKLNILIGLMEHGGGSSHKAMRQAGLSYDTNGDLLVAELIKENLLDYKQLKGDRNWVSINDEGRMLVKAWYEFKKNFG